MDRTSTDASTSIRLNMYTGGIIAFRERPLLGYGFDNRYNPAVPHANLQYDRHSHLHNAMINHLVAGGVFGLLAYFLLYFPIWQTLRNLSFFKSRFDFALSQFYGSFFVIGLTTSTVGHFAINTFFAITLTAILCHRTRLTETL
jgi:O-antigen ligase